MTPVWYRMSEVRKFFMPGGPAFPGGTMTLNLTIAGIIFGGWLFSRFFDRIKLPNILGMVIFGIIAGFFVGDLIPSTLWDIEPMLKSMALIVILLRAGLGLSKATLKKATNKVAFFKPFILVFCSSN